MANLADIRSMTQLGGSLILTGRTSPGDGGGGPFVWNPSSTRADDDGNVARPSSVLAASPGRWERMGNIPLSVVDFGADKTGVADSTEAIRKAFVAGAALKRGVHFPAGTYLIGSVGTEASMPWELYSGCTVSGDGIGVSTIKFADNGAAYRTLFNRSTTGRGITIRDLTIDQNATNNQSQKIQLLDPTGSAFALISITQTSKVAVWDCEFFDCFGINTIYIGGAGVSGVAVEGCYLHSNPIGSTFYDNSAIYVNCQDHRVCGNHLYGRIATGNAVSVCAVEAHGGPSVIAGNVVTGFLHSVNLVNSQYVDDAFGCGSLVTGNQFFRCSNGVVIWAGAGTTHRGGRISNNHMLLVPNPVALASLANVIGVGFVPGSYEDFDISENMIRFDDTGDLILRADSVAGIGYPFAEAATLSNVRICGNKITRAPNMGIALRGTLTDVDAESNTITDAGIGNCAAADHRSALFGDGTWTRVSVRDNTIRYTRETAGRCAHAVYLQPTGGIGSKHARTEVFASFSIDQEQSEYVT